MCFVCTDPYDLLAVIVGTSSFHIRTMKRRVRPILGMEDFDSKMRKGKAEMRSVRTCCLHTSHVVDGVGPRAFEGAMGGQIDFGSG